MLEGVGELQARQEEHRLQELLQTLQSLHSTRGRRAGLDHVVDVLSETLTDLETQEVKKGAIRLWKPEPHWHKVRGDQKAWKSLEKPGKACLKLTWIKSELVLDYHCLPSVAGETEDIQMSTLDKINSCSVDRGSNTRELPSGSVRTKDAGLNTDMSAETDRWLETRVKEMVIH